MCDPKQQKSSSTDCEVPVNMTLEALAHANCSYDDVRIIWGTDDVRVRTIREIKDLGYVCVRKFGLENEYAVGGEDPRCAFCAFRGTLG